MTDPEHGNAWTLTDAAVEDFCDIRRRDPQDVETFEREKAKLADRLRGPMKYKGALASGCELWRLTGKPRLYLVVSTYNNKVTAVRPEHGRKK